MSWNRSRQEKAILNKRYKMCRLFLHYAVSGVWLDDRGILREYSVNRKSARIRGNKKIRRMKLDYIPPKGHHKKLYEYKWEIL